MFLYLLNGVELEADIKYPNITPKNIMEVGIIFIKIGTITILFLIGLIHNIIAPVDTAIMESLIIGLLILFSSFILIQGVEFIGESNVDIVNRIE
jgi:hypothetical protein